VEFLKVDPLYMRLSVSFYREADGLFTFREHPRVKRIKVECARLSSGNLQLSLHVIGASWCYAADCGAFPAVITCACREGKHPRASWRSPLSPSAHRYLKQKSHSSLNLLNVRSDETPCSNPRPRLSGWIVFALGVSSRNGPPSETLTPCVKLDSCWWLW
jgi:hypothetical protein